MARLLGGQAINLVYYDPIGYFYLLKDKVKCGNLFPLLSILTGKFICGQTFQQGAQTEKLYML